MLIGQTIGSGDYRFEIESELGSGAMGTVFRARFHKGQKVVPVALKIVALGLLGNEGAMARFEREANILKQLKHPHIVRLYATGAYRKTPFIAMEFIDGEALDRLLARRGRLSWEEVVAFGKQLCEALQYAHEKGIIHRDLKPSNLMIASDGVLKLTDFGIAKDTDVTALTGQNSTIGTAAYMSPEQCKGDKNLSNKSDLYSLGIVFYELLTGKKPFTADTTVDMFLKHVNERAPRIGKQVNELPPKLEALIMQLMEKDKDDRPVDAAWAARMLLEIEEDAFARKSAGLLAASGRALKTRNLDGSNLDEADREAARALRGKRKRGKRKVVPFFQRTWVKTAGILLVLLGMGLGAYFAFRPASADSLAAAIDSAVNSPSYPDAKLEAATRYLEKYGDKSGELTDKAAAVFREETTHRRDEQLNRRFANNISKPDDGDDKETYDIAWQAMVYEKKGDLKSAAEFWKKVKARFLDEASLPFALKPEVQAKAKWGWVADKRLADLRKVEQTTAATRDKIQNNHRFELVFSTDPTNPESMAMRAFRLEDFGDREKAGRVWDQLVTLTEKDPDKRDWYLLASQQRAANKVVDEPPAARLERIQKQVDDAKTKAMESMNSPEEAVRRAQVREMCRSVIDLYDDETDPAIKALLAKAREIAATVPKS